MKKSYLSPEFEVQKFDFNSDVLVNVQGSEIPKDDGDDFGE
ncbi:MAG: hypothetical protein ACI4G0_07450 [Ruminococcus sp.]